MTCNGDTVTIPAPQQLFVRGVLNDPATTFHQEGNRMVAVNERMRLSICLKFEVYEIKDEPDGGTVVSFKQPTKG